MWLAMKVPSVKGMLSPCLRYAEMVYSQSPIGSSFSRQDANCSRSLIVEI
jgi:hypothetical protein